MANNGPSTLPLISSSPVLHSCASASPQTCNTSQSLPPQKKRKKDESSFVVKHRFKHSRPIIASQVTPQSIPYQNAPASMPIQQSSNYRSDSPSPQKINCSQNLSPHLGVNRPLSSSPHLAAFSQPPIPLEEGLTQGSMAVVSSLSTKTPLCYRNNVSDHFSSLANPSCYENPLQKTIYPPNILSPRLPGNMPTSISNVSNLHKSSQSENHNNVSKAAITMPSGKLTCPSCKSLNDATFTNNLFKCSTCCRQFIPIQMVQPNTCSSSRQVSPASFYGLTSSIPATVLTTAIANSNKKRRSSSRSKASEKQKQAETIDLVSSDEEERQASEKAVLPNNPKIHEQMKLQGGALPQQSTLTDNGKFSAVPPPEDKPVTEYKFECDKAMFGELYGNAIAPTAVMKQRIYLSLECNITRDKTQISEKYTLSVGQKDVKQIFVYFGRSPSFVAIEAAVRFSEVACQRIGSDVLVPNSAVPTKRYIILALKSAFKHDRDASSELHHLMRCVSPWAKVTILTHSEAILLVHQAKLDINQKEISLTNIPVKTLLIFPIPSSGQCGGGIPITNEDVACLEEGVYLNDIIIDFYLKYTFERILTAEQQSRTYVFNSYFYKRLTQKQSPKPSPAQLHAQVKKWTRNVDIFDKDFIVIPINEHSHWYLAIICFPNYVANEPCADQIEEDEETEDETPKDGVDTINDMTITPLNVISSESQSSSSSLTANIRTPTPQISCTSLSKSPSLLESSSNCVSTPTIQKINTYESSASGTSLVSYEDSSSNESSPTTSNFHSDTNRTQESYTKSTNKNNSKLVEQVKNDQKPLSCNKNSEKADQSISNSVNAGLLSESPLSQKFSLENNLGQVENHLHGQLGVQIDGQLKQDTTDATNVGEFAVKEPIKYKQSNEYTGMYTRPCILIFDSLVGSGHSSVFTNLRHYISMEWASRKSTKVAKIFDKTTMKGSYPKIPRQNNDCDCGIFLLQYVESFFRSPVTNFKMPIHLEQWFDLKVAAQKREEIRQLILKLEKEYQAALTSS